MVSEVCLILGRMDYCLKPGKDIFSEYKHGMIADDCV